MHSSTDLIPCIRPYFEIDAHGLGEIADSLASGQVTNHGPHLQRFERRLAEYLGVPETVVVSSGADALLLSLTALELPRGRAILPAYTYVATLNAVVHAGLQPLFCDIHPETFTLDPRHLSELLGQHRDVCCVLPINVFGVPPELGSIQAACAGRNITMVYDNAHGFGTETQGQRVPAEPEVQIFSLHATKALPAVEGGLIVSRDPEVLSRVKRLRNHGLGKTPEAMLPGFNSKMDEVRAIIGTQSLRHFPETLARRRLYGDRMMKAFRRFPEVYVPQCIPAGVSSNYQNLGVCCVPAERVGLQQVIELFRDHGVGVRSYFDPPLYKFAGFTPDHGHPVLPRTEAVWRTLISVPIHSRMTDSVLERIEDAAAGVARALAEKS